MFVYPLIVQLMTKKIFKKNKWIVKILPQNIMAPGMVVMNCTIYAPLKNVLYELQKEYIITRLLSKK